MSWEVMPASQGDLFWLCERAKCWLTPTATGIKTVDAAGNVRGVVAYDDWAPNSVRAHMAVESPIAWRSLVGPAFRYPFLQRGVGLIVATIPAYNETSERMTKHLGFKETYRIKDGWRVGEDMIVLEMRREECGWLNEYRKAA